MKLGTMVPLIEEKQRAKFRGPAATGWQEPRKQENTFCRTFFGHEKHFSDLGREKAGKQAGWVWVNVFDSAEHDASISKWVAFSFLQ